MVTKSTNEAQRRNFYRIIYSRDYMPEIRINGHRFLILDISEIGARIDNPGDMRLIDDTLNVSIEFHNGQKLNSTASLYRYEPKQFVIRFFQKIPYSYIVGEQIFLIRQNRKFSEDDLVQAS